MNWIAGSGDWNTASDWSDGVPTAADDAVFANSTAPFVSYLVQDRSSRLYAPYTVTGRGVAASLTIKPDPGADDPYFAGTLTVGFRVPEKFSLAADQFGG